MCGDLDAILFNAALHYEAAGLLGRAIRARQILLRNFPESPLHPRALYLTAGNYHALAIYEQAAGLYEDFARRFPRHDDSSCTDRQREAGSCPDARAALQNAMYFHHALGEIDRVVEGGRLFEAYFRRSHPRQAAETAVTLGAILEGAARPDEVAAQCEHVLQTYAAHLSRSDEAYTLMRLARVHLGAEEPERARAVLERIVARAAAEPAYRPQDPNAGALDDARSRNALGEASVLLLEGEHARILEALTAPAPPRRARVTALQRWLAGPFTAWASAREEEIASLQSAYGVGRPHVPEWEIVVSERLGRARERFAASLLELSTIDVHGATEEEAATLIGPISIRRTDQLQLAEAHYENCAGTAVRLRWFNDTSQRCLAALDRIRERPTPAELHAEASHVGATEAPLPAARWEPRPSSAR